MCADLFFLAYYGDHQELHVLPLSFPTRRSSDLRAAEIGAAEQFVADVPRRVARQIDGVGPASRRDHVADVPDRPADGHRIARLAVAGDDDVADRSEEHTSEIQSLMRNSYAVFCLKKKKTSKTATREQ